MFLKLQNVFSTSLKHLKSFIFSTQLRKKHYFELENLENENVFWGRSKIGGKVFYFQFQITFILTVVWRHQLYEKVSIVHEDSKNVT